MKQQSGKIISGFMLLCSLLFLTVLPSCSGQRNITAPSESAQDILSSFNSESLKSSVLPLGVFDLVISPDLASAEILPVRDADVYGDSWFSVLTLFFKSSPCRDCLAVNGASIDADGHVVLSIYARHPFKKGDQALPPDARNRDDLRVFDTNLIVATKDNAGPSFSDFNTRLSSNIVVNADGFTDMIDPIYDLLDNKDENTHPYITLFEDTSEGNVNPSAATGFGDINNASGHNVMNQDTSSVTDLVLNIAAGESHEIRLYLTANYGLSAENYLQRLNPRYYLPEFNAKEAWKVEATVESSSLGPTFTQSMAEALVQVWDWQHDASVDSSLTALDNVRASSEVKSVDIVAPGLFNGIVSQTKRDAIGNGKGDTPLEYHLEVYNELGAPAGTYPALVRVVDERPPAGNQTMPQDGINNNGFDLDPFDIPGFRTYDYIEFQLTVFWNNNPIARFDLSPGSDPLIVGRDEEFYYDATESYDVDGGINSYEWDFNYDRVTFEPEAGHDTSQGSWKYPIAGTYRIALRVRDNTIPMMTDITYRYVIVLPEQQNIAPRRICPTGINCDNLEYPATRTIKTYENNAYVVIGGSPSGERYIISSDDYGANFNSPVKVNDPLMTSSTQHVSGFDIQSTGKIGYAYFDENTIDQNAWFLLNYSTDGATWGADEILLYSTENNYVKNAALVYGFEDHEFLIFDMLYKSTPYDYMGVSYVHRLHPPQLFQTPPLQLAVSSSPISEVQFFQPRAAADDTGQIHVAFVVKVMFSMEDRYSADYVRIASDGNSVNREIIKISQTGSYDAQKDIDIAVDGVRVYVAFVEWAILSQEESLVLVASEDNGETWWTIPVPIADGAFRQINSDHPVSIAVDDDHRLHVVWAHNKNQLTPEFRDIWYDYSDDGGLTFHTDQQIYGNGVDGDQDHPSLTIDNLGRVHIVWWNDDETAGRGVWHTRFRS